MAHENMAHSLQWIIEYNGLEHECLEICMFNEQCALAVDEMGKECEQKVVQQKKWYGAAKVLSWDHSNNKISHFSMSLAWLCVSDGYVHSCVCVCKSFNRSTNGDLLGMDGKEATRNKTKTLLKLQRKSETEKGRTTKTKPFG